MASSSTSPHYQAIDIGDEINNGVLRLSENSFSTTSIDNSLDEIESQHSHDASFNSITCDTSPLSETSPLSKIPLLDSEIKTLNNYPSQPPCQKKSRLYWADCARIFSMIAIIFLHCAGYGCEQNLRKKKNPHWFVVCWYNCITRFGVPMFVLLSGTFILDPSKSFTFKKLFRHNILRLATAFTFWSSVNALINIYLFKKNTPDQFLKLFIVGEEYLWFIFMIVGCYLIAPFLRLFSDDIILTRYFLGLCIFWGSFIPTLKNIFTAYNIKEAEEELDTWTERWHFHFTLEFVGYFVAGYHIVKHVTIGSKWIRRFLYVLAIADLVLFSYLTYNLETKDTKRYSKDFRDTYTLTIAFYTVVLFIFFKHEIGKIQFSDKAIKIISKLSSLTFGVYLSHMIIKKLLNTYAKIDQQRFLNLINYSPIIGCPILWIIITILSFLVSYTISLLPIIRNYII